MKASSHCRPASWYIHSLSAACGDVWQTHCMHAVTIQVPLWVFLIRGACFIEWLEKRVLYYTVWAQKISGFLPKCPSPLCATRVLSDRAGRATYSNPPPPLSGMKNGPTLFLKHTALCEDHMARAVALWYMAAGAPAGSDWETMSRLSA